MGLPPVTSAVHILLGYVVLVKRRHLGGISEDASATPLRKKREWYVYRIHNSSLGLVVKIKKKLSCFAE
jgi:hypothetical protein